MDLSGFYQFSGRQVGVDRNNEKSLAAMEKEFELYPDNKKEIPDQLCKVADSIKKDDAPKIVQKEIESLLKAGLKEETDYSNLESLYQLAKSPEQMKFVASVKKEKFRMVNGWFNETMNKFYQEQDIEKKKILLAEISNKIETDENWKYLKPKSPEY
jgi:hypothetical protein